VFILAPAGPLRSLNAPATSNHQRPGPSYTVVHARTHPPLAAGLKMVEAGLPSPPPPTCFHGVHDDNFAFMQTTLCIYSYHIHDYTRLLPSHLISIEATNFGLVQNSLSFHKVSPNDRVSNERMPYASHLYCAEVTVAVVAVG